MQNKANFRKAKMNENLFATKDYENETTLRLKQNKPNPSTWFDRLTTGRSGQVFRLGSRRVKANFKKNEVCSYDGKTLTEDESDLMKV